MRTLTGRRGSFTTRGALTSKRTLRLSNGWQEAAGLDKSNPERTHATDALGYFVEREYPLRIDRLDPGRRFYK